MRIKYTGADTFGAIAISFILLFTSTCLPYQNLPETDIVLPYQRIEILDQEGSLICEEDCFDRLAFISFSDLFQQTFIIAGTPSHFFFDKPRFDQKPHFLRC